MKEIIDYLKARYLNEKAQGMVEYALIVAFIVGVAAVVFSSSADTDDTFAGAIKNGFSKVSDKINGIN